MRPRSRGGMLAGPFSGVVVVICSWLIAVPRMRSMAEELGVEITGPTRLLLDHAGLITTVALVIATLGMIALELIRRPGLRLGISAATSLILFGLFIWDMVVFWVIYVTTAKGLAA